VDKALCLSVEEADAIIDASRRNHVLLSVFHNRRWGSDFLTIKKVLDAGLLGDPYLFEASIMRFSDLRPPVQRVGADAGSYGRLQLRFENGVLYSVEVANLARIDRPRWVVLGERGSLVKRGLDPMEDAMFRGDIEAAREEPENRARLSFELQGVPAETLVESVRSDWTEYYRNVADALAGRAESAVRPDQVRRGIAVFDAARRSAANVETVKVRI
jgi:scyllo-inositol 2-dehydrogenase (NADP+)